jgi:hypothetical protein
MSILKDAKVGDKVEDSLGNKGVVYCINQTLGLYNVKFEGGESNSYNAAGYGFNNELQLIEGHLTSCIPAKEPTVLQTLPVAATKKYAEHSDTDVNGNIQILTPRGWEVCYWATEYHQEEWAHTPLYVKDPKERLTEHIQCALEGHPLPKPVLKELLTYLTDSTND